MVEDQTSTINVPSQDPKVAREPERGPTTTSEKTAGETLPAYTPTEGVTHHIVVPLSQLAEFPALVDCPRCGERAMTRTDRVPGTTAK